MPKEKPNILLLYTDQQRQDSLGCFGNPLAVTPNLDKLAGQGVKCTNYYVQNPVCMPSRMSFLTGRYPSSLGIGMNGIPFPEEDAVPVSTILKSANYHTAQIGKIHFLPHVSRDHSAPHPPFGFDTCIVSDEPGCYDDEYVRWVNEKDPAQVDKVRVSLPPAAKKRGLPSYSDHPRNTHEPYLFEGREDLTHSAFVADKTCDYLKSAGRADRPFFAIAGFFAPHPPVNPPARFVDQVDINRMPLPVVGPDEAVLPFLKDVSEAQWKKTIAYYLALASHVDACCGRILNALKEAGLEENTIVVFTSDHGEYLGDHGQVQKGMPGHDCITRVPFIIRHPRVLQQSRTVSSLIEAVDTVPTLLDFAGIDIPEYIQGRSLKNLLSGKDEKVRDNVLIEYFGPQNQNRQSTIKTEQYMYSCSADNEEMLFDRIKDPYEQTRVENLPAYAEALSQMRKLMAQRLQQAGFSNRARTAEY
jgi:arylsulfatase A-like enzyme